MMTETEEAARENCNTLSYLKISSVSPEDLPHLNRHSRADGEEDLRPAGNSSRLTLPGSAAHFEGTPPKTRARVFVYHRHSLCRVSGFIMSDSPQQRQTPRECKRFGKKEKVARQGGEGRRAVNVWAVCHAHYAQILAVMNSCDH
ncbi:hypothetical protein DPX16_2696 [Anabarilius grahami]|uniref:Uncharacterized protein n=1 Tax=Anabarilius grahami TaxID=495550 RepID=A0A3N0YPM9_ANAGA|nr:hypothetical protein DPX16_2696 [Anabarilius grahami]